MKYLCEACRATAPQHHVHYFHHHNRNLYRSALEQGQRNQETEDLASQTAGECPPNGC